MKKSANLKNQTKLTIGIPTCYGGQSLVETVKTLRASKFKENYEILIEADRTPITPDIKKALSDMKAALHWNNTEGSQCKKLKQIIKKAKGDIFVFTQDDIVFDPITLSKIKDAFDNDPKLTMAGIRVSHLKPLNFFEGVMDIMLEIFEKIAMNWNKGDNIFSASGRCLAFRTDFLKKIRLNNSLVNTDTFMYLENIKLGGKYKALPQTKVSIRPPQNLKEQIGPSSRYQYSQIELQRYFDFDIAGFYKIPLNIFLKSALEVFIKNPINFLIYIPVFIYSRINKQTKQKALRTSWDLDISTKSNIKA